jgi:hypothetical protein
MAARDGGAQDRGMSDSTLPPTPDADTAEQRRDAINRENFAIRRQLRDLTTAEHGLERKLRVLAASERKAKKAIESHSRAEHWGREPERPWAWRTAAPDPEGRKRISWRALGRGADVISAEGSRVGAVEHVLADVKSDIFDGVVIDTRLGPGGLLAVDPAQIALIFEDRIVLTVPKARMLDLPAAAENGGALRRRLRRGRQRLADR